MSDYGAFLASKRLVCTPCGIPNPPAVSGKLFAFQSDITRWALRLGRACCWANCGLGKGWIALEWARIVAAHTGRPVLILAPLAVSAQFVREGEKLGVAVNRCDDGADVTAGVNVTNYERLHRFEPAAFAGVVADECSILRDYSGVTRNAVIGSFRETPFRLACSATPAPNDHMEIGNQAEFMGVMTRLEMLAMFFCHDGGETQTWRLKGHAREPFWRWVCSWAVMLRKPSDLGYSDAGYELPPMTIHEHVVDSAGWGERAGLLFDIEARTLDEQRAARRASLAARVAKAAELANATPAEPWLVWCDLNAESAALTRAIRGAVEVKGSDPPEEKEANLEAFLSGKARCLVTKPSIAGHGLNMQQCARAAFVGLSHSWEAWYQAIRRIYRFGQERPVECHVITSAAEGAVVANIKRKQAAADEMAGGMVRNMAALNRENLHATARSFTDYVPTERLIVPPWLVTENA